MDDFGEIVMYAQDFNHDVDEYLYPNNRSLLAEGDYRMKHLVKATSLEFIFPELPIEDYEAVEWLSNSTYMPYFDSFLRGLDLNSSFSFAGECIGKSVGLVDKVTQFGNNFTYTYNYTQIEDLRIVYPLINFTGMIAFYLAPIPIDCFEWEAQMEFYAVDLFDNQMDGSVSVFLQAYLLSQMSNAKKYRDSIRIIQKNGDAGL